MNLIEASGNGDLKAVKKFIKAGADGLCSEAVLN